MKNSVVILLILLCYVLSCNTQQPTSIHANVTINTDATAKPYNPMIFGGFLEHFGKQIYGGVFDPGSSTILSSALIEFKFKNSELLIKINFFLLL